MDTATQDTGTHDTGRHDTGTQDTGTSCDQTFEPDNSEGAAATVTDGQVVHAAICPVYDQDWYTVYVPAGCTGSATLDFTNAAGDLDLSAWSGGANVATSNGTTNQEYVEWPLTSGGWLDFEVVGYAQAINTYTLSVAVSCGSDTGTASCTDDAYEPNDTEGEAAVLSPTTTISGSLCSDASPDWYSLSAFQDCAVDATLNFVDANGDLDLFGYESGTQVAASMGSTDVEHVRWYAESDEDVDLAVWPYGSAENIYSLHVALDCSDASATCPDDDSREDDDSPETAPELAAGQEVVGVTCDPDWVKVNTGLGYACIVDARADALWGSGNVQVALGDQWGYLATTTASSSTAEAQALASGDYAWARVTGDQGTDYRLVTSAWGCRASSPSCPGDDPFEPDDDASEAFPILSGTTVYGTLCGNDDWFRVAPAQGCTVIAELSWSTSDGSLGVYVTDAQGNTLSEASTTSPATASWTFASNDPLDVAVKAATGSDVPYTLTVDLACGRR